VLVLALTVIQEEVAAFPPSSWHHLSCADCLENKWGKLSELFFAMLCMTVIHHEWYTHMSSSYRWLLVLGLVSWATVCKMVHPMLSDHCPVCLSVTLVYCSQTVGWIKMKFGMEISLDPGHIVLGGDPAAPPLPKKEYSPQFPAHVYCGQTVAHLSYWWAFVCSGLACCLFFCFSLYYFVLALFSLVFFSIVPRDWLGRTSSKWRILCQVERRNLTQLKLNSVS